MNRRNQIPQIFPKIYLCVVASTCHTKIPTYILISVQMSKDIRIYIVYKCIDFLRCTVQDSPVNSVLSKNGRLAGTAGTCGAPGSPVWHFEVCGKPEQESPTKLWATETERYQGPLKSLNLGAIWKCIWCPQEQKEGIRSPVIGVINHCEPLCGFWVTNLVPLQEH